MKKLSFISICVSLLVAACGGGGGGGGSASGTAAAPTTMPVTPSLGKFSNGTVVQITKPNGDVIDTQTITNGTATMVVGSYTGPVVVIVKGGAGVTYFDEKDATDKPFGATDTLRAVLSAPDTTGVGVTALTNAAVAKIEADNAGSLATVSTNVIKATNIQIARAFFGNDASEKDILLPPRAVDAASLAATPLNGTDPADKYALVLAGLAKTATAGKNALDVAKTLAEDLSDGAIDGNRKTADGNVPITTPAFIQGTFTNDLATKVNDYVNLHGDAPTKAAPPTLNIVATLPTPPTIIDLPQGTNESDLAMAKAMFSELRNSLKPLSNATKTGLLDVPVKKMEDDLNSTSTASSERLTARMEAAYRAVQAYEDGLTYSSPSNTMDFVSGNNPLNGGASTLVREVGTYFDLLRGVSDYSACYLVGTPPALTKVQCGFANKNTSRTFNNVTTYNPVGFPSNGTTDIKFIGFEITKGAGNTFTYNASTFTQTLNNADMLNAAYQGGANAIGLSEGTAAGNAAGAAAQAAAAASPSNQNAAVTAVLNYFTNNKGLSTGTTAKDAAQAAITAAISASKTPTQIITDGATAGGTVVGTARANAVLANPVPYVNNPTYQYGFAAGGLTYARGIAPTPDADPLQSGTGTITKTSSGGEVTKVTLQGTFPSSTADTGKDTVNVSGEKIALSQGIYKYALSGLMQSVMRSDATKIAKVTLDDGSYITIANTALAGSLAQEAKFIGSVETKGSKFTGTVTMGEPSYDKNLTNRIFTKFDFDGSIADLSTGGAGIFLTGKLTAKQTNYNLFDTSIGESASNAKLGSVTFTGTIKTPLRPEMKLVLAVVATGYTTTETALTYTYSVNNVARKISGTGRADSANPSGDTGNIYYQDVIALNTKTGIVKKNTTTLATLNSNTVNFVDGVSESFN